MGASGILELRRRAHLPTPSGIYHRVLSEHEQGKLRLKRVVLQAAVRLSRTPVTIDLSVPGMGLFAHLSWMLLAVSWAEQFRRCIHFRTTTPQYRTPGRDHDWLPTVLRQIAATGGPTFRVQSYMGLPCANQTRPLTRADAKATFHRHFAVAPEIERAAVQWCSANLAAELVIAVHYRGTDKCTEAQRLTYSDVCDCAQSVVNAAGRACKSAVVFIATDEPGFLAHARTRLSGATLKCVQDCVRTEATQGIHNCGFADGNRLAREAMFDAVLLSRAHILLKTASALSGWSSVFADPRMPVVMLNQPYRSAWHFPDSLLASESFGPDQIQGATAIALQKTERIASG